MRVRLSPLPMSLVGLFLVTACGDPLVTSSYRGDPIFGLHGKVQVSQGAKALTQADGMSAGVLFLKREMVKHEYWELPGDMLVSVVKAELKGNFPADFSVELVTPPPVYPYNQFDQGIFGPTTAPEEYALGYLMVGPTAAMDALPKKVSGSFSESLEPLLEDVTVTPIQVVYAKGTKASELYPSRDEHGKVVEGYKIDEGFTLVDATRFFYGAAYGRCEWVIWNATYEDPKYKECLAKNADIIACVDTCDETLNAGSLDEARTDEQLEGLFEAHSACVDACEKAHPGQIYSSDCLQTVAEPTVLAKCGKNPFAICVPDEEQKKGEVVEIPAVCRLEIGILDPAKSLTVTVGDGDVKAGLAMLYQEASFVTMIAETSTDEAETTTDTREVPTEAPETRTATPATDEPPANPCVDKCEETLRLTCLADRTTCEKSGPSASMIETYDGCVAACE